MLQKFDTRNENLYIFVNGQILPRNEAKISVFDSVVQGGDAVWEGLRLYKSGIALLDRHLDRLQESAKALMFEHVLTTEEIKNAIRMTLEKNNMTEDVHIRLTFTRGEKITSGMDPRLNNKGCGLIVLAEWKPPVYDNENGIKIISSAIRRNSPQFLDSKIHHNNLLNNILAKIQANVAGKDAALMLDDRGFVAELNDTNIFMIKNGRLSTPHATACLPGITRDFIIEISKNHGLECEVRDISLTELYNADEVFCTGTMGELTPINEIDGRSIVNTSSTNIMKIINSLFREKISAYCSMP